MKKAQKIAILANAIADVQEDLERKIQFVSADCVEYAKRQEQTDYQWDEWDDAQLEERTERVNALKAIYNQLDKML